MRARRSTKGCGDPREEKSPEGRNPKSGPSRNAREVRWGVRRQGRLELRRRTVPGTGSPGRYGPFALATAEGSETPGEVPCARGMRDALGSRGVLWRYPEGDRRPMSGWRPSSRGHGGTAARRKAAGIGPARDQVEAERGEPNEPLLWRLIKTLEGTETPRGEARTAATQCGASGQREGLWRGKPPGHRSELRKRF